MALIEDFEKLDIRVGTIIESKKLIRQKILLIN